MASTSLSELWAGAVNAWVLGNEVLYLSPVDQAIGTIKPLDLPYPAVFEVTAFEPAGPVLIDVSTRLDPHSSCSGFEALNVLKTDYIATDPLLSTLPTWPTFGFDSTGYREDGIGIGCMHSMLSSVRDKLLAIAKLFGQGAIYEFHTSSNHTLIRSTVPTTAAFNDTSASVQVCRVDRPPDWSGGWGRDIWHPTAFYAEEFRTSKD